MRKLPDIVFFGGDKIASIYYLNYKEQIDLFKSLIYVIICIYVF